MTDPWHTSEWQSQGDPLPACSGGSRPVADDEQMHEHSVVFARSARRELERLGEPRISRVLGRIEVLALTPRPEGYRKIQGASNCRRIRVGDYRVLYAVDDTQRIVDIIAVRHRSDAYR